MQKLIIKSRLHDEDEYLKINIEKFNELKLPIIYVSSIIKNTELQYFN